MSFRKFIHRVEPSEADALSDFVGAIDIIEVYLGIGTGEPRLSDRLDTLLADLRTSETSVKENVEVLVDVVKRLRKVEAFLGSFWVDAQPPS